MYIYTITLKMIIIPSLLKNYLISYPMCVAAIKKNKINICNCLKVI